LKKRHGLIIERTVTKTRDADAFAFRPDARCRGRDIYQRARKGSAGKTLVSGR